MKIGLPREVMYGEGRVALVPDACAKLTAAGYEVFAETGTGLGSGYSDEEYARAGVQLVDNMEQLFAAAELIVKVKQPLEQGLRYLTHKHCVFSFLHLAPQPELTRELCEIGLTAIAFESVVAADGTRPLLAPMSAIAGRLSIISGANYLFQNNGGRGVLLGGLESTDDGNVVVLGAGEAGTHAIATATSLGAHVTVFDLNQQRLDQVSSLYQCETALSNDEAVANAVKTADIVVGAVMLAGRRAPIVVLESMVSSMQAGSVIVDIAIDQGGCVENIKTSSYAQPVYTHHDVTHFAVPNMPGAVPRTASQALSSAVLPYVFELLETGIDSGALKSAIAVRDGDVVDPVLREEQGL